jgi:hypothetical protein
MGTAVNIVLFDALATPVSHTFVPIGRDKLGAFWWEDQSGVNSVVNNRISALLTRPVNPNAGANAGTRVNRVKIGLHTPKPETLGTNDAGLTPPATVAYIPRANTEFVLPERANLQDRKDLRKYNANLMAETQVTAMVEALINVW